MKNAKPRSSAIASAAVENQWCKDFEVKGTKGTLLLLYVQPGASKTLVKGVHGDRLKISVKAPPVEGAANEAVIKFISELLRISKSRIHLLSGDTSRQKNIWLSEIASTDVSQCFTRT